MADGKVTETVLPHENHATFEFFVHADAQRILSHDFGKAGAARIEAFSDDAFHQIALGEDADQPSVMQNGNRANVSLDHSTDSLENGLPHFRLIGVLTFDEVANPHRDSPVERPAQ